MRKDLEITEKSIKAKRKTNAERMQSVLEAYYRIDKDGMKPHKISTTVKEYLEIIQKILPSIDKIKRYFKEEKLI